MISPGILKWVKNKYRSMDYRKTHLINDKGVTLVVETRDFNISQQNNDGKYDDYDVDVDWYLANGYVEISEARRIIEGSYYEHERQNEGI